MRDPTFDWNQTSEELAQPACLGVRFGEGLSRARLVDETLRDGLQNATGYDPPLGDKTELLHAMVGIGVDVVSVGLPAAAPQHAADTCELVRAIVRDRLPLRPTAAARTLPQDVAAVARVADGAGCAVEIYSFIGSSPIRHAVEGWDVSFLVRCVTEAAREATRYGLPFTLVTEDTTRSRPEVLRTVYRAAVDAGVNRICLADTSGHATPHGVESLVRFVQCELSAMGASHVGLDWHGHNDRGLALANALWAGSLGVERLHGTGLGVGERVGNPPTELLADNLARLGARPMPTQAELVHFCRCAAKALRWEIASSHPVAGEVLNG